MMKHELLLDIHTHTLASGHAYGTIREMAQEAGERGIQLLGISEHAPGIPGTTDPFYYLNLGVIPRNLYGVELLHGCEVNVLNAGTLSLEERYLACLDYAIAGIHRQCYHDEGAERNTDHLISCMSHEKVFFVAHPDDDHTPLDYERLVKGAREHHVALEVNNSSLLKQELRLNCVENYRRMLAMCMRYGVRVIVSSDAHDPSGVGVFTQACQLLDELGFDKALLLNKSVADFKDFIGYKK